MKTMRKRTLSVVFLLAVMLVCLVCPEGAKAAELTTDTFTSYKTVDGVTHEGKYTIPYILKNYNIFTTGDCEVSHVVGPVIVGGNLHKGDAKASLGGLTTDHVDSFPHHFPSYAGSTISDGKSVSEKIDINYFNKNLYFYTSENNDIDYFVMATLEPPVSNQDRTLRTDSFIQPGVMDEIGSQITKIEQQNSIITVDPNNTSSKDYSVEENYWDQHQHTFLNLYAGKSYKINFAELANKGIRAININSSLDGTDVLVFTDETDVNMPYVLYDRKCVEGISSESGKNTGLVFFAPKATKFECPNFDHGGHIVAPKATVNLRAGNFNGCIIAKEIRHADNAQQYSEGHMWPYNGKMLDGKPPVIKTGSLKVTKTVVDGTAEDLQKDFSFTVTYTDKDGKTHQNETFTLKDKGEITFSDLLAESKYEITEVSDSMFDSSSSNATGTILEGKTIEAKFTNTKIKPVRVILKAKKHVDGKAAVESDFSFILKDKAGREYTANNNGGTVTFDALTFDKAGKYTYTIQEVKPSTEDGYIYDDSVYDVNVDVSLPKGETALKAVVTYTKVGDKVGSSEGPTFNNTTKKPATGCLTITNKVIGDGSDPNKQFTYTVTYVDENGNKQTLPEKITLKHNESKSIQGLPVGVTYTVTENNANQDGYVVQDKNYQTAITKEKECVIVPFTNVKTTEVKVTLEAKKTLDGEVPNRNDFSFILEDKVGNKYTANNNGGTVTFDALTFDKAGKYTYTIQEVKPSTEDGYIYDDSVYDVNVDVSLPKGETALTAVVTYTKVGDKVGSSEGPTFNNTTKQPATGCLTITNTVTGDGSDPNKAFHYTVTYVDENHVTQTVAEFALKHGEKKIIKGLPVGVKYTVTENNANQDGYAVQDKNYQTAITKEKECVIVPFTNVKTTAPEETVSVSAVKVWKDFDQAHRPASVQVQLYKGGMAYGNPVELNAQNGWKTVWNGLDSKASWSVNELNVPEGYEKTISQDGNNWTITNTYKEPVDEKVLEDLPQTGDSSNLKLLFALGCLSLVGVAVMVSKKR